MLECVDIYHHLKQFDLFITGQNKYTTIKQARLVDSALGRHQHQIHRVRSDICLIATTDWFILDLDDYADDVVSSNKSFSIFTICDFGTGPSCRICFTTSSDKPIQLQDRNTGFFLDYGNFYGKKYWISNFKLSFKTLKEMFCVA